MRIILGITGGIAAFKSASLIRLLTEDNHEVRVVATRNALKFIGAATLEALSHNKVTTDLFDDVSEVKHIELAKWADRFVVAPATAAFIARYANGLADDILGNMLLATEAQVFIAPAMHTEMWKHPATVSNLEILRKRGVLFIDPEVGRLTGSDVGQGRLAEPIDIARAVLAGSGDKPLEGKKVLITAGGTREMIDPVRFIGNRSSGKQGIALGKVAKELGANVTFIACNIDQPLPFDSVIHVSSTIELKRAITEHVLDKDIFVMAAAVADFSPEIVNERKIKKSEVGEKLSLQLAVNDDILRDVSQNRLNKAEKLLMVGFAAETQSDSNSLAKLAQSKLEQKGCDIIVANDVSGGAVFDSEVNNAIIVTKSGRTLSAAGDKALVAKEIFDAITNEL